MRFAEHNVCWFCCCLFMAHSKSPVGAQECLDSSASLSAWINDTRTTCCGTAGHADPACTWLGDSVNNGTCSSEESFKRALLSSMDSRLLPMALVFGLIAVVEVLYLLVTLAFPPPHGLATTSHGAGTVVWVAGFCR